MTETTDQSTETVLVMNPQSGSANHASAVHDRADLLGYAVWETERENHAVELAQNAAREGADEIVAVGGDGTLNEVVRGVKSVGRLDSVTVGVVPAGTGNDFATNIGIMDIDDGFHALETGKRRRLDIGLADEQPFVNSCLAGITAEASDATTPEMKSKFGVFAYVLNTLQLATGFSGIELAASVVESSNDEPVWEGEAAFVLAGNGRRFSLSGSEQADVEDGLLDITIVEDASSISLAEQRLRERLLGTEGEHFTRILASSLELHVDESDPTSFSLDGEIADAHSMTLTARPQAVEMPVGDSYEPHPKID